MKTILLTILIFGVIINIHELGHFLFAKLFGVKVHEFSFGMGPLLFSGKRGETQYSVRLFPIGGFVAMEGEDEESGDGRAFCNRPAWQRFVILFAGAGMNLLLGLCLLGFTTSQMDLLGTNVVGRTTEGAASASSRGTGLFRSTVTAPPATMMWCFSSSGTRTGWWTLPSCGAATFPWAGGSESWPPWG